MKYKNIREEELKNKVGADWFKQFDTTEIIGNIDFNVFAKQYNLLGRTPLWRMSPDWYPQQNTTTTSKKSKKCKMLI